VRRAAGVSPPINPEAHAPRLAEFFTRSECAYGFELLSVVSGKCISGLL
jgi:hypothetical protein